MGGILEIEQVFYVAKVSLSINIMMFYTELVIIHARIVRRSLTSNLLLPNELLLIRLHCAGLQLLLVQTICILYSSDMCTLHLCFYLHHEWTIRFNWDLRYIDGIH